MQFEAKLTFDGLMTLIAGLIAFAAVIFQIRSSSKQVQDQIKAQRDAEEAGRERQRQSVAAALLSEMDCFYASQLQTRYELFEHWKKMEDDPQLVEVFHSIAGKPFAVYESLADKLGGFEAATARGIVLAYGLMANLADLLRIYEGKTGYAPSGDAAGKEIQRQSRESMRNTIRRTTELVLKHLVLTCRVLCRLSGTDFSTLFIAKDPELTSGGAASKLSSAVAGAGSGDAQTH